MEEGDPEVILVTGGAGFIGSRLVKSLVDDVVVVDSFNTGTTDNLRGFKGQTICSDVKDIKTLYLHPDLIFHLGMYSSSPMYLADHRLVGEVVAGATAVFDLAAACNAKVVYASTSSLYVGNTPPFREEMAPQEPADFYTEARIAVERLAGLYRTKFGVRSVGLRFFSVYGPGEESKGKYANMATQFVWAAQGKAEQKMGKRPTVYGDGSISRDFVHVDDVVRALGLAAQTEDELGVVNIGTGTSCSFNGVMDTIYSETGIDVSNLVDYIPMPQGYLKEQVADTSRAKVGLGFESRIGVRQGLAGMLD